LIVQFGAVFMHVEHPADLSRLDRIAAYYLMAVTFYTVIWSARISILFSIIRIDPDPRMRYRLKWLAAAFVAAVCGLLFQLFWTCEHLHGWKNKASPQCPLPKQVAIFQLISACAFAFFWDSPVTYGASAGDILADLALILLPIRLLRGIKDRRLRWRLIFIFSTSSESWLLSAHKA
jgi:H+/Cl- antiporter ClcA